ncbi:myotilin [Platysternon megacephalum]|uniref:Myotilin n=1 Tax=Platysternon megacephalum TaxID=55544 RepID=A0A4D9DGJ1_9SAUR|nr:myotilin [Platysternon megacephalum]
MGCTHWTGYPITGSMHYCLNLYLCLTYRIHLPLNSRELVDMQERILDIMQKQTALLENTVELCSHPAPQPSHPAACGEHRILGVSFSSPKFYPLRKGEQFPPTHFCELISTAMCALRSLGMSLKAS